MAPIVLAALSLGHFNVQVPSVQLTEHEPVQVTLQFALVQLTLLEAPTVTSQELPSPHEALHEAPQVPPQFLPAAHCSEQLSLLSLQPAVWVHPVRPEPQPATHSTPTTQKYLAMA